MIDRFIYIDLILSYSITIIEKTFQQ